MNGHYSDPKIFIAAKVKVMAIHPPTNTLTADLATGARPSSAPTDPNTTNATVAAVATTSNLTLRLLINPAARSGTIAPAENATAEAVAARTGLGSPSCSFSPPPLILCSLFIWATSISNWEYTDTNIPIAMLHAPAIRSVGACSMAIGQFVSVYSQLDIEVAQMKREQRIKGGGDDQDGLSCLVRATAASAVAFSSGAIVPLLAAGFISSRNVRLGVVATEATVALVVFGSVRALLGRAPVARSVRVLVGGRTSTSLSLSHQLSEAGHQAWSLHHRGAEVHHPAAWHRR